MRKVQRCECLVLAAAALIAGCESYEPAGGAPGGKPAQKSAASQFRYGAKNGDEFGYQIKIEAKGKDFTETYEGPILYTVVSADTDQFEVEFSGELKATGSAREEETPSLSPIRSEPPIVSGTMTITFGRRGDVIQSYRLAGLPYVLGDLETLVFEEFPEQDQASWQAEQKVSVVLESISPLRPSGLGIGPKQAAVERTQYTRGATESDTIRFTKNYSLEPVADVFSDGIGLNLTGSGEFVFDTGRRLIQSLSMSYRFTTEPATTLTGGRVEGQNVAITVSCRLLTPDEVPAQVAAREVARQKRQEMKAFFVEQDKHPELRGLRGMERLIAKLGLSDATAASEALAELAKTPAEKRSPEAAKAVAEHLSSSDVTIQRSAAQALVHWGTRDVEEAVVEATKSGDSLVAKYAEDALAEIQSQPPLVGSPQSLRRTWRDATGDFQIEARFLGLEDDTVRLEREDGQAIEVPLEKLSEADRLFVRLVVQRQSGADAPRAAMDTTPMDLLAEVNLPRDQVRGEWKMEDGNLITAPDEAATLLVPFPVPAEYTLTVVAERIAGDGSLCIGLVVGGRQTMLALEGWDMMASGLNTVGGRTADDNPTTFRSPVFPPGEPGTIVCSVRRSAVRVSCNGRHVMDWSGDPGQLDLDRRFWTDIPAGQLFLGTWSGTFRVSKMELAPFAPED